MSRRRGQSLAPSLFPFLAVLVCTLGTLILLLALVAQNAATTAEQKARTAAAELASPVADPTPRLTNEMVEGMLREEAFRVEQLVAFREQQTEDLERRRDELTHLEDHMSRLRAKLQAISEEVDRATGLKPAQTIDPETVAELRARIAKEREVVESLSAQASENSPRVVIVPHKGPNGTDRRPIYLECTSDGLTIWPEGSKITSAELDDAAYSANPLDAALRTIRLHAMKNYGDTIAPYPMLLVRPDGIQSYASARQAMSDWDDQFGYELVPAEVDLAYGRSDSELKRRVDAAIATAVKQQSTHRALAAGLGRGRQAIGGGTRLDGRRERLPVLSAAQLDRQGRTAGFGALNEPRTLAGNTARTRKTAPPIPYGSPSGGTGVDVSASRGGSGYMSPTVTDPAAETARRWAQEMRTAANEMRQPGSDSGTSPTAEVTDTSATEQGIANQAITGREWTNPSWAAQEPLANDANNSLAGGNDSLPSQPGDRIASGADPRLNRDPRLGPNSQSGHGDAGVARQPPPDQTADSQSGNSMPMSASQTSQPGRPPTLSAQAAGEARQMPSMQSPPSMQPPPKLVQRQGRDWALPEHMVGMQGGEVVRTISAECYADRFVLPPTRDGSLEVFGLAGGDAESTTLRLATALRDRIDRWGPALPGARWQPRLDVLVHPGGEMRFNQLRTLMSGSGIDVVGRTPR